MDLASPNSVLANALNTTIDILRPRVALRRPRKITFAVGTQINGTPHLGTSLTQCAAFVLAERARSAFSVDTEVVFGALDNAPHDVQLDPESHHPYQITYHHALGRKKIEELIDSLYRQFFDELSARTDVEYSLQTYSELQATREYRSAFLRTLASIDSLRWFISPSTGSVPVRLPCPQCGWAEKRAERTRLLSRDASSAEFEAVCKDHLEYRISVATDGAAYLDLNTLYRNVVKELLHADDPGTLAVMVKGGDWSFACPPVDWALALLSVHPTTVPLRVFTPQVLTPEGAKLSKSLIRQGRMQPLGEGREWMLDVAAWPAGTQDYVDTLLWLVRGLMKDPKDFYRGYSYQEIERLINQRPAKQGPESPIRVMRIYRKYYDLIADGSKTIEIRVGYGGMRRIRPGDIIRFMCQDDTCDTRVKRVTEYPSFDAVMQAEDPKAINPLLAPELQLAEIRKIFDRSKEALGVLAIEIERIGSLDAR